MLNQSNLHPTQHNLDHISKVIWFMESFFSIRIQSQWTEPKVSGWVGGTVIRLKVHLSSVDSDTGDKDNETILLSMRTIC